MRGLLGGGSSGWTITNACRRCAVTAQQTPTPVDQHRAQVSGYVWLGIALAVAGGIWLWGHHPWQHTRTTHHVVYSVTGSARTSGLIDYVVAGGQQQVNGTALPWTFAQDVVARRSGASVFVSAQNAGASGSISCEIDMDGKTVASNTSSGAYAVVSCSVPVS